MRLKHTLKSSTGSFSDKGIKPENEDTLGCVLVKGAPLIHKGITAAIADGMSGSDAGQEASQCCVQGFLTDYYSTPDSWSVKHSGQKILSATNSWLYSQGQQRYGSAKGMVSTLSILILKSTTGHIFHIGDSRIYRLRKGNFELMTRDHTISISEEKTYLNRAMGIEPHLQVDYKSFPLEKGDVFLMTTDGLHDFLTDKECKQVLKNGKSLESQAEQLVQLAVDNHSDDNLTCYLVKVEQLPLAKEEEVVRRHANLPFPPLLEKGMVLDDYRIEKELHISKRTQIYLAFDLKTQKQVILKTPSILYDDDKQYIEHFLYEEWVGKRISHENVLKVLDEDRQKSCIYYVTEYFEGQTLREWMESQSKPYIREVREIVKQIAKGLRAFHRMEMLHQDLKPENIIIAQDGTVKIIDFGSVKIAGIAEMNPIDQQEGENVLGTLNYTAPEYHLEQRGTIKSDLYSLAVIAYEMINGALPFGGDMPDSPNKINLGKLKYVPSFHKNTMVPLWIDGALKKACSLNPEQRYDEISEFIYDLSTPNPLFLKESEGG
ncbi:MAG: bifunctional protein-serine/threonine kinase/phosphatase, partial [Methylococcales bacterium]|nr:bifunctional protein-serine/threonine kinase/phosphatase [Methylococcales bacterium]